MKNSLTFIFLLITTLSFGQTKILFDASKAETPNNADWIIDADQNNLGYNNGLAVLNTGNEANAQRFPTPDQSGITSTTSQNYWKGALSAWGVELVKLGCVVETLPYNGLITYGDASNPQDLSNYKVYIVCEPNIAFTTSEKTALMLFVQNGGGLFMIADHNNSDRNGDGIDSPAIWNDFMSNNSIQNNPFGISFDYTWFDDYTSNTANLPNDSILHGSYGNVTAMEFFGASSMTVNTVQNATVTPVVFKSTSSQGNTNVLFAHAEYGNGRVVALSDSSPPDDGTGDNNDNLYDGWITDANGNHKKIIMNATIWLINNQVLSVKVQKKESKKFSFFLSNNQFIVYSDNQNTIETHFEIFNQLGQTIYQNNNLIIGQTYSLPNLTNGLYIYRISKEFSGKFVN